MSDPRKPEEVLASIRRLVAREVEAAQERDAAAAPAVRTPPANMSDKARAAARLVLSAEDRVQEAAQAAETAAEPAPEQFEAAPSQAAPEASDPAPAAPAPSDAPAGDEALRALIREVLREELRSRLGAKINENIRRIVQDELAHALARMAEEEAGGGL